MRKQQVNGFAAAETKMILNWTGSTGKQQLTQLSTIYTRINFRLKLDTVCVFVFVSVCVCVLINSSPSSLLSV